MLASKDTTAEKKSAGNTAEADYWWINSQLCLEHHPYLPCKTLPDSARAKARSILSKAGTPTLEYAVDENKKRLFHSWYNPVKEAKQWATNVPLNKDFILVVLGGGLFYHVKALLERIPDSWPVVVVERDEEIFHAAMKTVDLAPMFCRRNLTLCVGDCAGDVIRAIKEIGRSMSRSPVLFFRHPPSIQTFPDYYRSILNAFQRTNEVNSHNGLKYKKFAGNETTALLLTTSYFLMGDIIQAMERSGLRYRLVTIEQEELDCETYLQSLGKHIREIKPDFVLTLNHLGLDREGMVAQFFNDIEMPFASWYVDNPHLSITQYAKSSSPYCGLFLWDNNSVAEMKAFGFEHAFYAPLGVDERRFRPLPRKGNPFSHLSGHVGFVGNSMVHKAKRRLAKVKAAPRLRCLFDSIACDFAGSRCREVEKIIRQSDPEVFREYQILTEEQRSAFDTAVTWEATKLYRLERVYKILPFNPVIAGDVGWFDLIDENGFQYHKEISYYDELPYFYNMMRINFNATSRQMKGAVNQRVFDVPACNGFLLTDYEEQLDDLFDVGKEVVCYRDIEEIEDLVDYYTKHDEERRRIARKGYQRVIRDHTYVVRINDMVTIMKKIFKG